MPIPDMQSKECGIVVSISQASGRVNGGGLIAKHCLAEQPTDTGIHVRPNIRDAGCSKPGSLFRSDRGGAVCEGCAVPTSRCQRVFKKRLCRAGVSIVSTGRTEAADVDV